MRRGLISWSRTELPPSVLDARVARAQTEMAKDRIDALAIYSDPSRSAGASYFTAFLPYWNRGVMVLPRSGRPVLFTGMSNRVHGWIKANAHLDQVIYSTKLGTDVGREIADSKPDAAVAIPNLDAVPGAVLDGLAEAGVRVVDGTALMERLRAPADPAELAMFFKAANIARAALAKANATETDAAKLVASIDGGARLLGAEEAYISIAPDLGKSRALFRLEGTAPVGPRAAVRISLAYKGTWVRMVRTLARGGDDGIAAATEQFAAAIASLPKADALGAFKSWLVEGCRATQPLEALAGSMLESNLAIAPGTVVSVQATIEGLRGPVLLGAPVLIGRNAEPSSPLVQFQFDD